MSNHFEMPSEQSVPEQERMPELSQDQELIRADIKRTESQVDALFKISSERESYRYEPYFTLSPQERPYVREFFPRSLPKNISLKPENLWDTQDKTLALFMEASAQISEYQPPRGSGVREDTESLEKLYRILGAGEMLREKLAEERPGDVDKVMREVLVKSGRVKEDKLTGEDLKQFSSVINSARGRLGRSIEALRSYSGR